MSEPRRRAWECAWTLMNDHRDLLRPRTYSMCWAALQTTPEQLDSRRARRIETLFSKLLPRRREAVSDGQPF